MPRTEDTLSEGGYCWCGLKLIEGVMVKGDFFPLGFLNCPVHTCWYASKKIYHFRKRDAQRLLEKRNEQNKKR